MRKCAIIRSFPAAIDMDDYNMQELGMAKGLLGAGISTDIYSRFKNINRPKTVLKKNGLSIRIIPMKGIVFINRIALYPGLYGRIANGKYNIVQLQEESQPATVWLAWKLRNGTSKLILHQGVYRDYSGVRRIYQVIFDSLFQWIIKSGIDFAVAKTKSARAYLLNKGYRKVFYLPIGLDYGKTCDKCRLRKVLREYRKKYDFILLYIGKIEKRRNPFFLIDVFKDLKKRIDMNIGMIVVGSGDMKSKMEMHARNNCISEEILFIDSIRHKEISEVYNSGDVLLLPSSNEIYGMVVLEALSCGLPVVSSEEAGPLDILSDAKYGCCLPLNRTLWVNELIRMIKSKPSRSIAGERKKYVRDNYNWDKIVKEYLSLLG